MENEKQPATLGSGSSPNTTPLTDERDRIVLFTQVCSMGVLAGAQDPELAIRGYAEFTKDIPLDLLRYTLQRLLSERDQPFVPAVGLVRQRAALEVLRSMKRRRGEDPNTGADGREIQVPTPARIPWYINVAREQAGLPKRVEHPTYDQLAPGVAEIAEGIGRA